MLGGLQEDNAPCDGLPALLSSLSTMQVFLDTWSHGWHNEGHLLSVQRVQGVMQCFLFDKSAAVKRGVKELNLSET